MKYEIMVAVGIADANDTAKKGWEPYSVVLHTNGEFFYFFRRPIKENEEV